MLSFQTALATTSSVFLLLQDTTSTRSESHSVCGCRDERLPGQASAALFAVGPHLISAACAVVRAVVVSGEWRQVNGDRRQATGEWRQVNGDR